MAKAYIVPNYCNIFYVNYNCFLKIFREFLFMDNLMADGAFFLHSGIGYKISLAHLFNLRFIMEELNECKIKTIIGAVSISF